MPVEQIHTYLVHPRLPAGAAPAGGAPVALNGKLFELLNDVYEKSDQECDIDISFDRGEDGAQTNPCRDEMVAYLGDATLERGRIIAQRLGEVTTKRSGMGLLFLISGHEGADHKLVVSRFPTDSAILAEENAQDLNVEFLERVFMKSAFSYKAVAYRHHSLATGFWDGRAIDKQIANPSLQVSTYWIKGFLKSDFRTTSAAGTRRLAEALRNVARTAASVQVKKEVAAAATLGSTLPGEPTSILEFCDRFALSSESRDLIAQQVRNPAVLQEQFVFDSNEFTRQIAYRSVELDSGAILTAQATDFDAVFDQEEVSENKVRFSTTGKVVGESLRKVR